jgi:hypothetical protein
MYLLREVFQAQRGKAPDLVAGFKILDHVLTQAGCTNSHIYVDYTGSMDTVVYQFEVDSLDRYYTMERGIFVDPDDDTKSLIDLFNTNATAGHREIYQVLT